MPLDQGGILLDDGHCGDEAKPVSLATLSPGVCFGHSYKLFSLSKHGPHRTGHGQRLMDNWQTQI